MPLDLSFDSDAIMNSSYAPFSPPSSPPLSERMPPRFVPTLTEVVQWPAQSSESVQAGVAPQDAGGAVESTEAQAFLVHRVMQRVDATIAQRLNAALAELVAAHTAQLEPLLRQEIEAVVRDSVRSAIAQELKARST